MRKIYKFLLETNFRKIISDIVIAIIEFFETQAELANLPNFLAKFAKFCQN